MSQPSDYYDCPRPELLALVSPSAHTILDVGCAAGALGFNLKQRQGAVVWGVEYVPEVAARAAERLDHVLTGGIEDVLPNIPDGYFDIIICADVLEHLVNPWQVLANLKAKLSPGGEVVASIPNVRHWSVLRRLLEGQWDYFDAGILDRTHLRFFTWKSCESLFSHAGFDIYHAEAVSVDIGTGIPATAITAMAEAGLDVGTLAEESRYFQFLVKARPLPDQPAPEASTIDTQETNTLASHAIELAEKSFQNGDIDGAVTLLIQQGIKADPHSPQPYVELVRILTIAGRHDETLQVVSEMPPAVDAVLKHEIEAASRCALGDNEAAKQSALAAGERPRPLVVLGTLAAREGDAASAESFFRRAIGIDPTCSSAWLALSMLLWSNRNITEAWQAIRNAVSSDPLNTEAVTIFQDMARRLDCAAEALAIISSALLRFPDSRHLAQLKTVLLAWCGKDLDCLESCEKFILRFGCDDNIMQTAREVRARIGAYDRLHAEEASSVSLCMIVKNEERSLPRCLASCTPFVHELIVVDTGSSDRTRQIAEIFGAHVLEFPWTGDFAAARNFGLSHARGAWILVMDADEVLAGSDLELFRTCTASPTPAGWSVLTRNYTRQVNAQGWTANDGSYPAEETADGWKPSWKVRLLPNSPLYRFRGEVHEMVEPSLRETGVEIRTAPFVIHHYGEMEEDPERAAAKRRRYFEIGRKKLEACPNDPAALAELSVQAGELGEFEQAIELWNQLLIILPNDVEALFNKGYCLMGLKRYPEALDVSRRALELAPDHKEAAFNFGTCALYAGEPSQALSIVAPCASRNSDYPLLQALLAALYIVTDQIEQSRAIYRRLTKLCYDIGGYLSQRADSLESVGRPLMANVLRAGLQALTAEGETT